VNETTQDRSVVLTVVVVLGIISVVGVLGLLWLVHSGTAAGDLLAITGVTGPAVGALTGILASTRTATSANAQSQAQGYQAAVADVTAMGNGAPHAPLADPLVPNDAHAPLDTPLIPT